jgi:hypothetical protein
VIEAVAGRKIAASGSAAAKRYVATTARLRAA